MIRPSPENRATRSFGYLLVGVFSAAAVYVAYTGGAGLLSGLLGALSISLLAISLVAPRILAPLLSAWLALGMLLGKVVSPIVLAAIFFLLITPVALFLRIARRDALRLRAMSVPSYWVDRTPPGPEPDSFKRQF